MTLIEDLRTSEERLSRGDLAYYWDICRDDALFVMPGMVATREEAIAGLEHADPWDSFDLSAVQVRELGTDAAAIAYRFEGRRGAQTYTADMVSTYVREGGRWLLAVHQQTPA